MSLLVIMDAAPRPSCAEMEVKRKRHVVFRGRRPPGFGGPFSSALSVFTRSCGEFSILPRSGGLFTKSRKRAARRGFHSKSGLKPDKPINSLRLQEGAAGAG